MSTCFLLIWLLFSFYVNQYLFWCTGSFDALELMYDVYRDIFFHTDRFLEGPARPPHISFRGPPTAPPWWHLAPPSQFWYRGGRWGGRPAPPYIFLLWKPCLVSNGSQRAEKNCWLKNGLTISSDVCLAVFLLGCEAFPTGERLSPSWLKYTFFVFRSHWFACSVTFLSVGQFGFGVVGDAGFFVLLYVRRLL